MKKLTVEGKDTVMVHSFGSVQPCLHVQKDVQVRDASASVSLEEIQQRVFVKYVFWFSCLWFQDRTFSLILLVFPYTFLTRALNCLFVSPYMKILRHVLVHSEPVKGLKEGVFQM